MELLARFVAEEVITLLYSILPDILAELKQINNTVMRAMGPRKVPTEETE